MKSLNRHLISVLLLSFLLSLVPVFAQLANDVDQGIPVTSKSPEMSGQLKSAKPESIHDLKALNYKYQQLNNDFSKPLNLCGIKGDECSQIASLLLFVYLIMLIIGRRFWVVEPNSQYLKSHADRIKIRLEIENAPMDKKASINNYLEEVKTKLDMSLWKKCMAFTGIQMSAWRSLHEAERLAIDFYHPDVVKDQANLILDKLYETQTTTTTLENELRNGLDNGKDLRSLVKEAKAIIYRDEDEQFEALADAQNKALWLVIMAAMILFGLSWLFPQAQVLFLSGAAGGLLARLRKVVRKRSLPFDYGVSWTVLFLTPLVGALTGWAGTLLFIIMQDWGLIGTQFKNVSILVPSNTSIIVALLFGYSATLFEKFVEQLEESIGKK